MQRPCIFGRSTMDESKSLCGSSAHLALTACHSAASIARWRSQQPRPRRIESRSDPGNRSHRLAYRHRRGDLFIPNRRHLLRGHPADRWRSSRKHSQPSPQVVAEQVLGTSICPQSGTRYGPPGGLGLSRPLVLIDAADMNPSAPWCHRTLAMPTRPTRNQSLPT